MSDIREVIVLFKTHLDMGYTDLAENVRSRYVNSYVPKALQLARELREQEGKRIFVWTTGSWLIDEYLRCADDAGRSAMERAIAAGDISWHGLPFTTHTELMDADLVRYGIEIAQRLDKRFGRKSIAAKLTDVPGHTRGLVSLLADAGIEFLHIGVNPVSVNPDVPTLFRWQAPDGKEITVMYQFGYGGYAEIPGTNKALMFAHTGDNNGPQSADAVLGVYRRLEQEHPGVCVRPGDLNDIALAVREIRDTLPVVTQEIGDTWIHGGATDPRKMSGYRALLRLRKSWKGKPREIADRWLLEVPEHTWGLDYKTYLKDHEHFRREEFEQVRGTPAYRRMEHSWDEQRDYLRKLVSELTGSEQAQAEQAMEEYHRAPINSMEYRKLEKPGQLEQLSRNGWELHLDESGAIDRLSFQEKPLADAEHRIGVFQYEAFSRTETDRFCRQYIDLSHFPELEHLAIEDFNKLGAESAISEYLTCGTKLAGLLERGDEWVALLEVESPAVELYGCPRHLALGIRALPGRLELDFAWWAKPATRVPEALWLGASPIAENCRVQKLDQPVDPLDVVQFGGQMLHGTDWGVKYDGMSLQTMDTACVNIGKPSLWNFTGEQPNPADGCWFNLYNNMWDTNFPLWYDEDARFRFILEPEL